MVKAVFGQPITADDVERLPPDTGATAFVRLCAVLIGRALAERVGHSVIPQVTERVMVPDRMVDAEYTSPFIDADEEPYGLIGPGKTVFQFKFRDSTARGRTAAFNGLRAQLRKDFARGSLNCDRFVFMTNLHLAGSQPHKLRQELDAVPSLSGKPIVIWGAAEIAVRLNQSPHLRHLFFSASGSFCTIDVAEEDLKAAYESVGWPLFTGRDNERAAVEAFAKDTGARLIQVVGPRYVGKTRLVIEALKPYASNVIWSSRSDTLTLDHLRDLDAADENTILVLDGCDSRSLPRLLEDAANRRRLKTILIRDGSFSETGAGKLVVTPLAHEESVRLISGLLPRLSWRELSWMRETTGGSPGLILHLAALLNDARISPTASSDEVRRRLGALVEEKYLLSLNADARQALSVAALLPVLGTAGDPGKETDAITQALGLNAETFSARLLELEKIGLIRRRGRFIEVVPPILAERVATQALRNPDTMLAQLRLSLDEGAFRRFLRRFRDLPNAREVIERLFSQGDWFPNLDSLIIHAKHFEILAPAAPTAALRSLEELLTPLPPSTMAEISDDSRRSIVSTLERLALRSATFTGAAKLLLALAENENERWSNNATGVFTALFHWQHPEVAAPYSHRLAFLNESIQTGSAAKRKLAAQAIGTAFKDISVGLHEADGADLPERPYRPATWDEVRQYGSSLLDIMRGLFSDSEADTRQAAIEAFLTSFRSFVTYSLTADGLADLGDKSLNAIETLGREARNATHRTRVVSELELLQDQLTETSEPRASLTTVRKRTERILGVLTRGDIQSELWRWAGPASWKVLVLSGDESDEIRQNVDRLARHFIAHPSDFELHISWLLEDEAERRWDLFLALGRADRGRELFGRLITRHDKRHWPQSFSAYISGWAAVAMEDAEEALENLSHSRPDLAVGIMRATASLQPTSSNVNRILNLLTRRAISTRDTLIELAPLRWEDLSPEDFGRLVEHIDDETVSTRTALLWPFLRRLSRDIHLPPKSRTSAWAILQSTADEAHRHDWDFLAAKLGKSEPHRLLSLLESLLVAHASGSQSLSLEGRLPLVWRTLQTRARADLIRLLLKLEIAEYAPPWVGWELERLVLPNTDAELLLAFAREHGVDGAKTVAGIINASRAGFWDVAQRLLQEWGDDADVQYRLLNQLGAAFYEGSAVPLITERLESARRLTVDGDPRVAAWAREAVQFLEGWRQGAERDDREEWIWDYRIGREQLENMVRLGDSPQRLWAIGRLLKNAPPERVRELLSPEDILAALPKLTDLDELTRRKWTAYASHLLDR
jgi:hypothetical protein